jgi:hypothetical protein
MFNKRTVFIIGAGCSHEFGLPLGPKLMDKIYEALQDPHSDGYAKIYEAFIRSGVSDAEKNVDRRFKQFAAGLSGAQSIDQYLDFHQRDPAMVMLGKCAVAAEIFRAECQSELRDERAHAPLPDVWPRRLLNLMMTSVRQSNAEQIFANVSFICFNYDRIIEVFFRRAIPALAHTSADETAAILRHLQVWHPYGTIGGAEPTDPGITADPSPSFTARRVHPEDVLAAAKRLRTFTEGAADKQERDAIRNELINAQQIVFLGFSYLEDNMRLLSLGPYSSATGHIFGTVYEMPAPTIEYAKRLIVESLGPDEDPNQLHKRLTLVNLTASNFLWEYGPPLRS